MIRAIEKKIKEGKECQDESQNLVSMEQIRHVHKLRRPHSDPFDDCPKIRISSAKKNRVDSH